MKRIIQKQVQKANENKKVLVHCALNMRVSVFIYLFRVICQKVKAADAKEQLYQIWQPNQVWQEFIDNDISQLEIEEQKEIIKILKSITDFVFLSHPVLLLRLILQRRDYP